MKIRLDESTTFAQYVRTWQFWLILVFAAALGGGVAWLVSLLP